MKMDLHHFLYTLQSQMVFIYVYVKSTEKFCAGSNTELDNVCISQYISV